MALLQGQCSCGCRLHKSARRPDHLRSPEFLRTEISTSKTTSGRVGCLAPRIFSRHRFSQNINPLQWKEESRLMIQSKYYFYKSWGIFSFVISFDSLIVQEFPQERLVAITWPCLYPSPFIKPQEHVSLLSWNIWLRSTNKNWCGQAFHPFPWKTSWLSLSIQIVGYRWFWWCLVQEKFTKSKYNHRLIITQD